MAKKFSTLRKKMSPKSRAKSDDTTKMLLAMHNREVRERRKRMARDAANQRFGSQKLTAAQQTALSVLRSYCADVEVHLVMSSFNIREQATALTKLEEFAMWATKAISRSPEASARGV